MSNSADFRARRERCGLTQLDVADALGVRTMTVKRWEKPAEPDAPADAWAFLEAVETARRGVVKQAEETALRYGERGAVQLTYYRTQEQFDAFGRDEGPVGVANANARAVADRLESMGFEIAWAYPDDEDNIYHGGSDMKATYILTTDERVLRLEGNGDVHDLKVKPYADPDVIYEGPSLDEARAAAAEFADENPCEFIAQGLGAVVAYHELECNLVYEDGECEDAFTESTLTEAARERLYAYADAVDEACEELDD